MRSVADVLSRETDSEGRLVIGSNARPCPFCNAEPVHTVTDRVRWIHPPVSCCDKQFQLRDPSGYRATKSQGRYR
jgi:hypothetical protein